MSYKDQLLLDPAVAESYQIIQARRGQPAAEKWLDQYAKMQQKLEEN